MVVYIFPIDVEKARRREIDAGKCEEKIKSLGLKPINDPTYRETAASVKRLKPKSGKNLPSDWVRLYYRGEINPDDVEEVNEGESIIIIDPELHIKPEDIDDDFSFGNGTTIGGVRLKSGEWILCGFVVFDHKDKENIDKKIKSLKDIFMGKG